MARFMIEVTHESEPITCAKVVKLFLSSGSHLLTHADWGCMDDDHRAWIVVDVANKNEAMTLVPPALRPAARVIGLNTFSLDQINAVLEKHASA